VLSRAGFLPYLVLVASDDRDVVFRQLVIRQPPQSKQFHPAELSLDCACLRNTRMISGPTRSSRLVSVTTGITLFIGHALLAAHGERRTHDAIEEIDKEMVALTEPKLPIAGDFHCIIDEQVPSVGTMPMQGPQEAGMGDVVPDRQPHLGRSDTA
jgi:hypothetical protein